MFLVICLSFENIKQVRGRQAVVLNFLPFSPSSLVLMTRDCLCFTISRFSQQLSDPRVFTSHLPVVSGFQFPVKYLILNLEIEMQLWMWTTVNQRKGEVLSYQHHRPLLLLCSLFSVTPAPSCLSNAYHFTDVVS